MKEVKAKQGKATIKTILLRSLPLPSFKSLKRVKKKPAKMMRRVLAMATHKEVEVRAETRLSLRDEETTLISIREKRSFS